MVFLDGIVARIGLLTLALAGLAAFAAASARGDAAAPIYDRGSVAVIELELPQASIQALEADPEGAYQPGTFSLATDATPAGGGTFSTPLAMEIRLKGSASFKPLSGKAAFKIKFPKAGPFLGLRKMTLNNMVEDPSMIHETLAYETYRAAGVPASRTGFAYLRINGIDYGVYLNIENLDDVALTKIFGGFDDEVQHMYEGENGADVKPELIGDFEIDEGDEADISDLEALVTAVNAGGSDPWSTQVAPFADLEEMTRMWAVEKYAGQFDGYAGGLGSDHPNNYYLYSDPLGRFQMLPWGQDETWKEDNHLDFDGPAGLLFDKCLADAGCESAYVDALTELHTTIPDLDLDTVAVCTAATLAPWQELEEAESTRFEWDAAEIAAGVAETREFIATRPAELADWLGLEAPDVPSGDTPCPADEETPSDPDPDSPGPDVKSSPPAGPPVPISLPLPAPKLGPTRVAGSVLSTRVTGLPGGGVVVQRGRIPGRRGPVGVCSRRVEAGAASQLTVRCVLSKGARQRLRSGALKVTLVTSYRSENVAIELPARTVNVLRS
jgi:hypothetical protein